MVKSNKKFGKAKKALKGGDMTIGWSKGTEKWTSYYIIPRRRCGKT